MNFLKKSTHIFSTATVLLVTSSHLNAGTFKTYKEDSDQFRQTLNQNDDRDLAQKFTENSSKKDGALYLLEQARIQQVNQNYDASLATYKKAFELLKSKAVIPDSEEIEENSRARSAKMRTGIKI